MNRWINKNIREILEYLLVLFLEGLTVLILNSGELGSPGSVDLKDPWNSQFA